MIYFIDNSRELYDCNFDNSRGSQRDFLGSRVRDLFHRQFQGTIWLQFWQLQGISTKHNTSLKILVDFERNQIRCLLILCGFVGFHPIYILPCWDKHEEIFALNLENMKNQSGSPLKFKKITHLHSTRNKRYSHFYIPGPSKGCQLNPKGWRIDTL